MPLTGGMSKTMWDPVDCVHDAPVVAALKAGETVTPAMHLP